MLLEPEEVSKCSLGLSDPHQPAETQDEVLFYPSLLAQRAELCHCAQGTQQATTRTTGRPVLFLHLMGLV